MPYVEGDRSDCQPLTTNSLQLWAIELANTLNSGHDFYNVTILRNQNWHILLFFGMIGISHIPKCMVTRLPHNHNDMSITPLSYVVLSLYLLWMFFGTLDMEVPSGTYLFPLGI